MHNYNRRKELRMLNKNDKAQQEEKTDTKGNNWKATGKDDFWKIIFKKFLNKRTLPFQKFLDDTGDFFDRYILETCQKENWKCFGGKLTLEKMPESKDIHLSADLYFQSSDQKWNKIHTENHVDIERFNDWDTNEELLKLCKEGKIEMTIEPPKEG